MQSKRPGQDSRAAIRRLIHIQHEQIKQMQALRLEVQTCVKSTEALLQRLSCWVAPELAGLCDEAMRRLLVDIDSGIHSEDLGRYEQELLGGKAGIARNPR